MRTMSGSPCLHYDCSNRNSFGYCKTTVCINELYQWEQWSPPLTTNKSESIVIKQATYADRIRAMADEELAEWIEQLGSTKCPCDDWYYRCEKTHCDGCWLSWLKSPMEKSE